MSPLHHALSSSLPWYKKWHETKHHSLAHYGFLIVFLALTTGLLFSSPTAHAAGTTYYVSSSTGNDSNTGTTTTTPWKSLTKVSATTFKAGDSILFMRGDTFTGTLTVTTSGTSTAPITYGAYGTGNNPIISGFTQATGWTNTFAENTSNNPNLWETTNQVSTLPTVNLVTVNGVNTPMGRYPNSGFLTYQNHSGTTSITSSALTGTPNWKGAELVMRSIQWMLERNPITAQSGGTLTYTGGSSAGTNGYGFFIQNDLRTVDSQNEWYYNPTSHKLDMYSTSMPTNVQVASVDVTASDNNKSYVSFNGIDFMGANSYLFQNTSSKYLTIQNGKFAFAGKTAFMANGTSWAENVTLTNNTFTDNSDNAIFIGDYASVATITNNTINNTGMIPGAAYTSQYAGDAMDIHGPGSIASYNTITNTGHTGIYIGNTDGLTASYNLVSNYGMTKYDAGGIYSWNQDETVNKNRLIDHNIILDSKQGAGEGIGSDSPSLFGVYLDGHSNNTTVSNNTISNAYKAGIFAYDTGGVTITNNTVYNNGNQLDFVYAYDSSTPVANMTVQNNVFFSKTAAQQAFYYRNDYTGFTGYGTSNNNYYARPIDDNKTISTQVASGTPTTYTLSSWQAFQTPQDSTSKKSPLSITTTNDLSFQYNATNTPTTISFPGLTYEDVKGTIYNGSITLAPWTSAVLIKTAGTTDTTPPTISLTAPTNGSIISGNATLTATASDNVAVASVSFYADTTLISTDTTAPYQATLNTLTLSPGTHTIKATASDAAGNTASSSASVTIQGADTTAPSVALTSPTGGTVSGTITPTATATDNVAVASVAFKVDTTLIATDTTSPYTATLNTTTLSDGLHTIQAIATDTSGNTNTASVIVTVANTPVDTTPPTVSITAPSNNATLSGTTAFSATAGDNVAVASVSFYADNTLIATDTTAPYTTSIIPSSLAIGTHTLKATATDTSGNSTSASITVSVPDTTLPTVSLTSPTSGSVSGTITIQATASDNIAVSKVLFYADTTLLATDTAAPYTATLDTTTLAIGTHTLKATASDAAGNTASSTVSVTIPDQTSPTVSLTAPTPGATLSGNATLSATATDNVAVASVAFYDGSTLISSDTTAPYTTSWNTTTTSPGIHTLSAIAKDAAGNATTSATISVTVKDQSAPTVSITAPTGGTQLSGTTTILATASDNVAVDHVDFYQGTTLIGADATAPYSITWDTSAVANASYTLKAIAYDATGNATTAATVSVTVYNVQNVPDTWAPTVSITAPTAGSTINGTTTLTAAAADTLGTTHSGVASVSFYRGTTLIDTDTTASPNYNITWNTTLVADGSYTLKAIATDASGNSTTSTTVTVTVKNADTTPPTVVISSPANNATIIGMTTIAATASDNIAVSKVLFYADTTLLATDTAAPYTTTLDATTLAPGLHTLKATASDAAGNTATATVSVSVTSVDTTPPTLSFTYPTQGNLVPKGSAVSLVISATDNTAVASVAMYVGSTKLCTATTLTNGYYSCTWNVPPKKGFFGFLNVKYTLKAIATDTSGNTKTVSESVTAS